MCTTCTRKCPPILNRSRFSRKVGDDAAQEGEERQARAAASVRISNGARQTYLGVIREMPII